MTVPYLPSSSRDAESFAELFLHIMDHRVNQGDIDLSDPKTMREGVKSVAQLTFRTYINLHGGRMTTTETSSAGESHNRFSLAGDIARVGAGSSSAYLSNPATSASHPMTATTACTSVASGGHRNQQQAAAAAAAAANPTYTLSPSSPYGMGIPRSMAGQQPRQFMAAPPMAQGAADMAAMPPTFGCMNPGDPAGGYYYPYVFTPQSSWAAGGTVPFPPGHMAGMSQDFGMGGANFFSEAQNYGTGSAESG